MRSVAFYLLLILTLDLWSQHQGIVINSESGEPIPYVNIWVKGKSVGTNSDGKGVFQLSTEERDTLVFSAVGFERQEISLQDLSHEVLLKPAIKYLHSVTIEPERSQETVINPIKSKKCNYLYGVGDTKEPWMMGVRFVDDDYSKTPFLDQILFQTKSEIKNALLNIRLYQLDSAGFPYDFLLTENLLVRVKKGKRINKIDLSQYDIQFPPKGLAVVVEWFIIPENKFEYEVTIQGEKKRVKAVRYEPTICTELVVDDSNTLMYKKGMWSRAKKFGGENYRAIKVELILSN